MTWLGLTWDEGPFFQAQRVDIHREMVQKLVNEGKAYYCTCTPEELEEKRKWPCPWTKPKYTAPAGTKNLPRSATPWSVFVVRNGRYRRP
jgi:glutamyl-tRNA synthetase